MNHSLSIEQLKRLKVIMQTMLSEANNANWQELSRLDSERRVLINYRAAVSQKNRILGEPVQENAQRKAGARSGSISGTSDKLATTPSMRTLPSQGSGSSSSPSDFEYLALSKELTTIDNEISSTVHKARQILLEQTRDLKAQVSAKKGYEQANTMKVSSYS